MSNNYDLLKTKEIIEILDGDIPFEDSGNTYRMPYLSGPTLCSISTTFGLAQEYKWDKGLANLSRWQYMNNIMDYCIKNETISSLLSYLFSIDKFKDVLKGVPSDEIEEKHKKIVSIVLNQINSILYFGGHQLVIVDKQFIVNKIGTEIKIEAPTIKVIDRDYINSLSERALKDILENNYDSAITKARTILEETFCYVLESKGEVPSSNGDIGRLYKQVKDIFNMHPDKTIDVRINTLLSGLEKIITSITEMRNANSDSHGVGNKRLAINDYHARLLVNASVMMSDFILSVYNNDANSI